MLDSRADALIDDVLEYIEDGRVIPIIGDELLQVTDRDTSVPLYTYLARKLAERLAIPDGALPPHATLNEVVCHYLRAGGVPEEIHPKIRPILNQARFEPPEPLRQLGAIDRFNLFVVLTFDSLLANAIDQVRFGGESRTVELAYSPKSVQDLPEPRDQLRRPVVYHLLGKLSSGPDYVITEEDTLEFMHHMQRQGRTAGHLFDALRDNHLMLIGCTLSDWLVRFLIRVTKSRPLSLRRTEMELIVSSNADKDTNLVEFLRHFSPRSKIVSCPPAEFVAELEARYRVRKDNAKPGDTINGDSGSSEAEVMEQGAIFISYTHDDHTAARRLRDFLEDEAGVDVWLDTSDLQGGDAWDGKIRRNIKNCSYFIPLISANAIRRREGYFRREWRWAGERAQGFHDDTPFILPVVIDDTPNDCEGVPDLFAEAQWMRAPGGDGSDEFRRRVVNLIRDYRKRLHG
jgi:hypothetical protein